MQLSDNNRPINDFVGCVLSNKTAPIELNWVYRSSFVAVISELGAIKENNVKFL